MKINVTECTLKLDKGNFKIYQVTTSEGKVYDTFQELSIGEHEGEIKENENPEYNDQFKPKKQTNFKGKNYDFEKRRVAHETAVTLWSLGKIRDDQFRGTRDKFFEYLNQ